MPPRSSPRMRRRDFIAGHSVAAPSPVETWRSTHWIEGRSFHAQVHWGRRVTARNHGAARAQAQWKSELGRGRLLPPGIGNEGRLWCRWQSAAGAILLEQHDEWAVQHRRYTTLGNHHTMAMISSGNRQLTCPTNAGETVLRRLNPFGKKKSGNPFGKSGSSPPILWMTKRSAHVLPAGTMSTIELI